jgi:putative hydrolase of the HAD superfamily
MVFDVDDTLYLERDYVRSGFNAVGLWIGIETGQGGFADACWQQFENGMRGDIFDRALHACGMRPHQDLVRQMVDIYRTHAPHISLLPDARRAVDLLNGRYPLALISDGPLQAQQQKVRALGLDSVFDPILLTDMWSREARKPCPRAFVELEQQFGLPGGNFVYVADNPAKDFVAPRQLGWQSVRVRRPLGLHFESVPMQDAEPDWEIEDLHGLERLLARQAA